MFISRFYLNVSSVKNFFTEKMIKKLKFRSGYIDSECIMSVLGAKSLLSTVLATDQQLLFGVVVKLRL